MRTTLRLIMLCFLPFAVCSQPHQDVINKTGYTPSSLLRKDGLYNSYDTSHLKCGERIDKHYITYRPLIVINGTNAMFVGGASRSFSDLSLGFYHELGNRLVKNIGIYTISEMNVKATLPIVLFVRGMREKLYIAYFEGKIKNRDTIINWRMVEPYPKAPRKFNDDFKDLLKPRLLYFMKSDELSGLDALYQQRLAEEQKKNTK